MLVNQSLLYLISNNTNNIRVKDVVWCSGLKKSMFFTYFESIIYWEYTVKILDQNMKYLRSYST